MLRNEIKKLDYKNIIILFSKIKIHERFFLNNLFFKMKKNSK